MEVKRTRNKICQNCGKPFKASNFNVKFCSAECRLPYVYTKKCQNCGKEFETKQPRKTYCSKACCTAYNHERYREKAEQKQALKKESYTERMRRLAERENEARKRGIRYGAWVSKEMEAVMSVRQKTSQSAN